MHYNMLFFQKRVSESSGWALLVIYGRKNSTTRPISKSRL